MPVGGEDRVRVHRSRAVADRAEDAAGHLRQRRRSDRAAELRTTDVLAVGGAWAAADADGDILRRAQRADAWAVAAEGRDPGGFGCRSLRARARRFRVRRGGDPGSPGDAVV